MRAVAPLLLAFATSAACGSTRLDDTPKDSRTSDAEIRDARAAADGIPGDRGIEDVTDAGEWPTDASSGVFAEDFLTSPISHPVSPQLSGCSDDVLAANYCPTALSVSVSLDAPARLEVYGSLTLREQGQSNSIMGSVELHCHDSVGLLPPDAGRATLIANVLDTDNPAGLTFDVTIVAVPRNAGLVTCRVRFDGEKTADYAGETIVATGGHLRIRGPVESSSQNIRKSARSVVAPGESIEVSRRGLALPLEIPITLYPCLATTTCLGSDITGGRCPPGSVSTDHTTIAVTTRVLQLRADDSVCAEQTAATETETVTLRRHHLTRSYAKQTAQLRADCPVNNVKLAVAVSNVGGNTMYVDTNSTLAVVLE